MAVGCVQGKGIVLFLHVLFVFQHVVVAEVCVCVCL